MCTKSPKAKHFFTELNIFIFKLRPNINIYKNNIHRLWILLKQNIEISKITLHFIINLLQEHNDTSSSGENKFVLFTDDFK